MNQPNLTFRQATLDDLDFVSYCNYTASSPSPDFCYWDVLIEGFGIETMAFIRQAIALDVLAWCRISDFIIAENRGIPVAGASCFVMSQDDYRPIDLKSIGKLYSLLEWNGDRIKQFEEKYQTVWYNPKDETLKASGTWTIECVAVVEQFRGQEISKDLLNYIIREARSAEIESIGISVTIGNEIAERLYLSVGFQKYITFFSEYYVNQFPGTAKFRLMTGKTTVIEGSNMTTNKRALVTGGNRGIGFAIAQGLIDLGFEVIITARSIDPAEQAAKKLGKKAIPLELDVSDDSSIENAIAILTQQIDSLDILINNAGVYPDKQIDSLTISRELLNIEK